MKRDKFIFLFSKKLSGEIETADRVLLDKANSENEEYKRLAKLLTIYYNQKHPLDEVSSSHQLNQVWTRIYSIENENFEDKYNFLPSKSQRRTPIWIGAAAVLIVLSFISFLAYKLGNQQPSSELVRLSTNEEKTFKMMDDGTRIWLNKHSSLVYNKAFGKTNREITLSGEAYFDVARNAKVPLFIHVGDIDVEVKGTAFNVRATGDKKNIEVALVRGLIQVSDRQQKQNALLLHPNQKIVYGSAQQNEINKLQLRSINPSALLKETGWIADTLVFRKEKLRELAAKLEKKYDVKINIQSDVLKEKRFSGIFINETLDQALTSLKLSYPLIFTINKRMVFIKEQE
ncbi:FecR family protein [Pedobacter sp. Leaf132]|nr:FecR domain-containing protein [Pedobacter sp. Leaf132]